MSNELKKGELFIKEVLARLTGDNNEALAAKVARKAISAFEGQIASLNSKKVDLENTLEEAIEALHDAEYPLTVFSSNETYIQNILNKQSLVDIAKDKLEATDKALEYFKAKLAKF